MGAADTRSHCKVLRFPSSELKNLSKVMNSMKNYQYILSDLIHG